MTQPMPPDICLSLARPAGLDDAAWAAIEDSRA